MATSEYRRIDRVIDLARTLRANKPFNAQTLGNELGLTARTVKRDIQYLRSRGWVIEWMPIEHEYSLKHAPRPYL